jgi:hypothetical protein
MVVLAQPSKWKWLIKRDTEGSCASMTVSTTTLRDLGAINAPISDEGEVPLIMMWVPGQREGSLASCEYSTDSSF